MRLTRSFPTSLTVLTWNVYLTVFAQGCCFIMCAVGIGKGSLSSFTVTFGRLRWLGGFVSCN
ncbi:hypothetical protein BDV33DRAFT_185799 [Aspergillus novoparasiticus]|uniref:Uncharacterized protein n=1 Tax=Aspergillus novoparasiticus TaxID=986946 RepID=A0A5N6E752_9EURO|nr:hypothetical protein BDV33DRAFT_185799 [Aspergillus novoparasiticus]